MWKDKKILTKRSESTENEEQHEVNEKIFKKKKRVYSSGCVCYLEQKQAILQNGTNWQEKIWRNWSKQKMADYQCELNGMRNKQSDKREKFNAGENL